MLVSSRNQQDAHTAVCSIGLFGADFTASWISYMSSLLVSHPIDTLRIRLQATNQSPLTTLRVDGARSLYAGMSTPIIANGPLVGVLFAFNELYRPIGRWLNVHLLGNAGAAGLPYFTFGELLFAGGMAGLSGSVFQCPINIIRMHQQISARAASRRKLSAIDVMTQLWTHEGLRGFFRAWPWEALGNFVGRMVYFSAYEVFKTWAEDGLPNANPTTQKVLAAVSTSTVGWISVFPLDLVKNRLQADNIGSVATGGARQFRGFAHCCEVVYRERGLRGFWAGFTLTITRSAVASAVSLPIFDYLKPNFRSGVEKICDATNQERGGGGVTRSTTTGSVAMMTTAPQTTDSRRRNDDCHALA